METVEVARSYMARGWSPIPIPAKQKAPRHRNWQTMRLGLEQLALFFMPTNIGVLLGEPSGWLVDVDLDHALAIELASKYLPATDAIFGRASKKRSHWLYTASSPIDTHKRLLDKRQMVVELRSTGCQTVFPGSVHPSGEQIDWDSAGEPSVVAPGLLIAAINALADAVQNRLKKSEVPKKTGKASKAKGKVLLQSRGYERCVNYLAKLPNAVSGEGGHNATLHAAATCFRFGLTDDESWRAMRWFNANKTEGEPWTENELAHKLNDARSKVEAEGSFGKLSANGLSNPSHGMKDKLIRTRDTAAAEISDVAQSVSEDEKLDEVDEEPKYVAFPTDVLPNPVREFVEVGATALGCDPAYIALPVLAAIGSAVGNSRRIKLKNSWCEPCVVWAVIIGESGTLKSPALDLALAFLRARQAAAYREFVEAMKEYERQQSIYEADLTTWKRTGRKNSEPPPDKPEPPIWRQSIAEDTTVEALAVLLEDQPRGLLVARDELAGWLNSFDAYKSARGADVAHWLSMHRAGNLLVNRKTGRRLIRVPRAAVGICGGVQPQTLAAALAGRYSADGPEAMDKPTAEHFANGLAARLLLAMPPRIPKQWTDADLTDADRLPIARLFDDLLSLEADTDDDGEWLPVDLPLTLDAKRLFVTFFNDHAVEQCALESDLAAAWSKIEGYAARLALLCQLIRDPQSTAVDDLSMKAGIELARWFADEAARVYGELGAKGDGADGRQSRDDDRLTGWIRDHGGAVTVRDVTRGPRQYRGDTEAAEAALNRLVEAGRGKWDSRPATNSGGRPTQVFVLATVGDGDITPEQHAKSEVSSPSPVSPDGNVSRVQVTI